jgi:hypothetical protein
MGEVVPLPFEPSFVPNPRQPLIDQLKPYFLDRVRNGNTVEEAHRLALLVFRELGEPRLNALLDEAERSEELLVGIFGFRIR